MKLSHGLHLAYCTNIHRGETWVETFGALQRDTLAVRDQVCPKTPYTIGLRLSEHAARELSERETLLSFKRWLDDQNCYVFTINGFPYGRFHGARVKEQVYTPDWTTPERLAYTNLLFNLLVQLLPPGVEGSVSTVPISFKEFIHSEDQVRASRENIWRCVKHIARLCENTGHRLHLGLEPEPLCYLETTEETVRYFEQLQRDAPGDARLAEHLGINYDCCHLAVEFEEPTDAFARLRSCSLASMRNQGIKISKIHLSSALKVRPTPEVCEALRSFADDIYFHQVVARSADGKIDRFRDLDVALNQELRVKNPKPEEWRIHFHIPLHSQPTSLFDNTSDHLLGVLDILKADPTLCSHLEMETYTWEVMPPEMKNRSVVDQLVSEYRWMLAELAKRGIAPV